MDAAYELLWNVEHFARYNLDETHDLDLIEPHDLNRWAIYDTNLFDQPEPLVYAGYPNTVRNLDYPSTGNDWTVVSRKMYDALVAVGDFPHRTLPTRVIDCQVPRAERYQANGKLRPEIEIGDFITVHITEHLNIFDWEKSKYARPSKHLPDLIAVEEYVFKIPPGGLPPLFRVKAKPIVLFVSAVARQALKIRQIAGTRYVALNGNQNEAGDFVDVPIKLED